MELVCGGNEDYKHYYYFGQLHKCAQPYMPMAEVDVNRGHTHNRTISHTVTQAHSLSVAHLHSHIPVSKTVNDRVTQPLSYNHALRLVTYPRSYTNPTLSHIWSRIQSYTQVSLRVTQLVTQSNNHIVSHALSHRVTVHGTVTHSHSHSHSKSL
jgi:hypothetical protein